MPSIPQAEPIPSFEEVESLRKDTMKLYRQYAFQSKLCSKLFQESEKMEWTAQRDAGIHKAYEAKTDLRIRLDTLFRRFNRISCRQLCHKVQATLPREVRDMIYTAMLDRGHASKNCIQLSRAAHERHLGPLSLADREFPPSICRFGMPEIIYQHCWETDLCGSKFVQELVEMCYRDKTFEFRQQDVYLLPAFLGQEAYSSAAQVQENAVVPLEQVGKLRLLVRPTGNGWEFTLKILKSLLELKRKAKLDFILDQPLLIHSGTEVEIDRGVYGFQALFPLLASIRDRGHTVRVYFGSVKLTQDQPDSAARSPREWADIAQGRLNSCLASTKPLSEAEINGTLDGYTGRLKAPPVAPKKICLSKRKAKGPAPSAPRHVDVKRRTKTPRRSRPGDFYDSIVASSQEQQERIFNTSKA